MLTRFFAANPGVLKFLYDINSDMGFAFTILAFIFGIFSWIIPFKHDGSNTDTSFKKTNSKARKYRVDYKKHSTKIRISFLARRIILFLQISIAFFLAATYLLVKDYRMVPALYGQQYYSIVPYVQSLNLIPLPIAKDGVSVNMNHIIYDQNPFADDIIPKDSRIFLYVQDPQQPSPTTSNTTNPTSTPIPLPTAQTTTYTPSPLPTPTIFPIQTQTTLAT